MLRGDNFCPVDCPGYYEPILHTIGVASTVCNVFGIFLTVTKAKKNNRYRFCQLYVQVTSLLTEFDLSIVNPAYFFFPMIGGINCGPMRYYQKLFGVTSHYCITFFAFMICLQVPAILCCFLYRHQAAANCSPDKTWKLSKAHISGLVIVYHLFPCLIAFSLFHSGLTLEEKKISLIVNYPDCQKSLDDFTFDTYDYQINSTFVAFGILISVYYVMAGVIGFGLAFRTGQILNRYRYIMSARTYQLHKSSMLTLTTQVTGPTLFLGVPVFAVYVVVASQMSKLHTLASTAPFFISMHSMVSTICMILTTPQFKSYVSSLSANFKNCLLSLMFWKKKTPAFPASPVVPQRPRLSVVNTFF